MELEQFYPYIIIFISILVRLPVAHCNTGILWPDSLRYYNHAKYILRHHPVSMYSRYATPFYPLFLAIFICLGGEMPSVGRIFILTQHLLSLFSAFFFFQAFKKIFNTHIAFISALLFSLNPLLLYYEETVLTETLFIFFFSVFTLAIVEFIQAPNLRKSISAGIASAFLTLTRPIAQFLPFFILPFIFKKVKNVRRGIFLSSIMIGIYVFFLMPWLLLNHNAYSTWALSQGKGVNLFFRVYEVENITPVKDTEYPRIRKIFLMLKKNYPNTHVYFRVRDTIEAKLHLTSAATDEMMYQFALEGLKTAPLKYFLGTLKEIFFLFFNSRNSIHLVTNISDKSEHIFLTTRDDFPATFTTFPGLKSSNISGMPYLLIFYFTYGVAIMPLVSVFALYGIFNCFIKKPFSKPLEILFLLATICYFALITCVFNMYEDRYRLPLDGFLFLFATFGVAKFIENFFQNFCNVKKRNDFR